MDRMGNESTDDNERVENTPQLQEGLERLHQRVKMLEQRKGIEAGETVSETDPEQPLVRMEMQIIEVIRRINNISGTAHTVLFSILVDQTVYLIRRPALSGK